MICAAAVLSGGSAKLATQVKLAAVSSEAPSLAVLEGSAAEESLSSHKVHHFLFVALPMLSELQV